MRTAIFTTQKTMLTIETTESLSLEQMGVVGEPKALIIGKNAVPVGPGVFRIFSTSLVKVTSDTPDFAFAIIATNKDDWPDPPKLSKLNADPVDVHSFFFDTKGQAVR